MYQISDDRLIVVMKILVVIKQKESGKSFEFTPSRLALRNTCMFVTKYRSRFVCIGGYELVTFHVPYFPVSPVTLYVRDAHRTWLLREGDVRLPLRGRS